MAESSQSQQRSDAPLMEGGVAESSQSQQKSDAPDGGGGWLKVHNLNKGVMPLMEGVAEGSQSQQKSDAPTPLSLKVTGGDAPCGME